VYTLPTSMQHLPALSLLLTRPPPRPTLFPYTTLFRSPVEVTRHAFAYVFAGAGKFCNASEPLEVPTEPVGWLETTPPPSEADNRSEEHTSELQSPYDLVCRLLLEKKKANEASGAAYMA